MGRNRTLIYGVAINDRKGKISPLYSTWKAMWQRVITHPAYSHCSVHKKWHKYSNFEKWAYINGYKDGLQLDKDLLGYSIDEYGPKSCCFISQRLNKALVVRKGKELILPLGVYKSHKTFSAKISLGGLNVHLLNSTCLFECHEAWKVAKAKELRTHLKDLEDNRIKLALLKILNKLESIEVFYTKEDLFK